MWKYAGGGRGGRLTLIGRIQIVKSFTVPKFMSKASPIHVSNDLTHHHLNQSDLKPKPIAPLSHAFFRALSSLLSFL